MTFLRRYLSFIASITTLLFSMNGFAQERTKTDSTVMALKFVDTLLPEGNYIVEVLGSPPLNAAESEILKKMKLAIQQNQDWFLKTMSELKPGELMPYHKNLGISEQEYAVFIQVSQSVKIDKIGIVKLKIIHKDNSIYFVPEDFPHYLKELAIHLKDYTIVIDSIPLKYKSQRIMDSKNTTLVAGPWKGYSWDFEEIRKDGKLIADPDKMDPSEINTLDIKSVKLTIGKLDHNDQCFLYLRSNIVNKGHVLAKQDIALLLKKE